MKAPPTSHPSMSKPCGSTSQPSAMSASAASCAARAVVIATSSIAAREGNSAKLRKRRSDCADSCAAEIHDLFRAVGYDGVHKPQNGLKILAGAPGFSPRMNTAIHPKQAIDFTRASASCVQAVDTILRPVPRAHSAAPQGIEVSRNSKEWTLALSLGHERVLVSKAPRVDLGGLPGSGRSASDPTQSSTHRPMNAETGHVRLDRTRVGWHHPGMTFHVHSVVLATIGRINRPA